MRTVIVVSLVKSGPSCTARRLGAERLLAREHNRAASLLFDGATVPGVDPRVGVGRMRAIFRPLSVPRDPPRIGANAPDW